MAGNLWCNSTSGLFLPVLTDHQPRPRSSASSLVWSRTWSLYVSRLGGDIWEQTYCQDSLYLHHEMFYNNESLPARSRSKTPIQELIRGIIMLMIISPSTKLDLDQSSQNFDNKDFTWNVKYLLPLIYNCYDLPPPWGKYFTYNSLPPPPW